MKIVKLLINNYFSFERSEIVFEDYNIMVGPNASGKTNIRRILELLCDNELGSNFKSLEDLRINPQAVFDKGKPICIGINVLLSNSEAKMLFGLLFKREIKRINCKSLKKVMIILYWEDYTKSIPDNLFLYITNGILMEKSKSGDGLFYVKNIPDDLILLPLIAKRQGQAFFTNECATRFHQKHGFLHSQLLQNTGFQDLILNCKDVSQYFSLDGEAIKVPVSSLFVLFNEKKENHYLREIFDYCNLPRNAGYQVDIWTLIRSVIKRNISFYQYITKDPTDLAHRIFDFEKTNGKKWQYDNVRKGFKKIFPKVKFEAVQTNSDVSETRQLLIKIIERKGYSFNIQDTASGYYETLYLFSEIVSTKDSVLVIDEPALHLHPIKIRLLSKVLSAMTTRQVIMITHSPFFVSPKLFENNQSLIYVKKDKNDNISNIINKPVNFDLKLKPYIFNPEIFFSKLCLFVEGPGDEYAIRAIDESLNNILEENDVLLVNVGGKENVEPYITIIENYKISHVIMVDKDYTKRQTKDTIKLSEDLEDVMRKIGWRGQSDKISPGEAYRVVAKAMENYPDNVKKSEIGIVFDKALSKVGVKLPKYG